MHEQTIVDCIGHTPFVALERLFPQKHVRVFAKLDFFSPTGSIKDRIVKHIVLKAEQEGRLRAGATIIEATSGNTGAAVAMIAAARGYRSIVVMPEKASWEKQAAARALGAEVVVCANGIDYIKQASDLAAATQDAFYVDQYDNLDNVEAHYLTTGPEIWDDAKGRLDVFVAGGGTGGTVTGVARYLKQKDPRIRIIMPDPHGSIYEPYFRTGRTAPHTYRSCLVEGIGKDRLVDCMDFALIDGVVPFDDREAFDAASRLARQEGILAGGSSGANIWACMQVAEAVESDTVIVTVLPDSGLKYLSKMYDAAWYRAHCAEPAGALADSADATAALRELAARLRAGRPTRASLG